MVKGITKTVGATRIERTQYKIDGKEAEEVLRAHFNLPDEAPLGFVFTDHDGDYIQPGGEYSGTNLLRIEGETEVIECTDEDEYHATNPRYKCPHEAWMEDSSGAPVHCSDCGYSFDETESSVRRYKQTKVIYMDTWIRHNRVMGTRYDGGSLHLSEEDYKEFVTSFCPDRAEALPDEYSTPDRVLTLYDVPLNVYKDLEKRIVHGKNDSDYPGFRYGAFITQSQVNDVLNGSSPFK